MPAYPWISDISVMLAYLQLSMDINRYAWDNPIIHGYPMDTHEYPFNIHEYLFNIDGY